MQYVKLGRSGLDVSPIAIGAMTYGEPSRGHPTWSLDEETSRPLIRHALEQGINLFDTANLYSQGSSEEILGRALDDFAYRDEVVIATKVRHRMFEGPNGTGLSRKAIMSEVDNSLRRLGTDYIDLYQIHRLDMDTPVEESLEALQSVTSGRRRWRPGSSASCCTFRSGTGELASSRCRTTTTCSAVRKSGRCCRCASMQALAPSRGARSRVVCSRGRRKA
jgi:predicted oxidoreductase